MGQRPKKMNKCQLRKMGSSLSKSHVGAKLTRSRARLPELPYDTLREICKIIVNNCIFRRMEGKIRMRDLVNLALTCHQMHSLISNLVRERLIELERLCLDTCVNIYVFTGLKLASITRLIDFGVGYLDVKTLTVKEAIKFYNVTNGRDTGANNNLISRLSLHDSNFYVQCTMVKMLYTPSFNYNFLAYLRGLNTMAIRGISVHYLPQLPGVKYLELGPGLVRNPNVFKKFPGVKVLSLHGCIGELNGVRLPRGLDTLILNGGYHGARPVFRGLPKVKPILKRIIINGRDTIRGIGVENTYKLYLVANSVRVVDRVPDSFGRLPVMQFKNPVEYKGRCYRYL